MQVMAGTDKTSFHYNIQIKDEEYVRLSSFIMTHFGIKLPPSKKTLLQCRLQKRLKALKLTSFAQYTDYILSKEGGREEVARMIEAVSTNKTDFYREPGHFDYLRETGIRDYLQESGKSRLSLWSAGCSSGEEPYTLAIELSEYMNKRPGFDFHILATDISNKVLETAIQGIYPNNKVSTIPPGLLRRYMLRGKNQYADHVRILPELRTKIDFRIYNLLSADYSLLGKFDIIFCRNVLIYFDREVQHRILKQFIQSLNTGGYLFLGHSESITGHSLPLHQLKPTMFKKIR